MNRIPSNEQVWVTICSKKKDNYHVITSKDDSRSRYYIYNCHGDTVDRLGYGKTPTELENQWPL